MGCGPPQIILNSTNDHLPQPLSPKINAFKWMEARDHFSSLRQEEIIVFGYIRLNYKYYISPDISKICLSFYNQVISCSISHDELLSNCPNYYDKFIIKKFIIHDCIRCELVIEKYHNVWDDPLYRFYIRFVKTKYNSCEADIFYKIYCHEYNIKHKNAVNHTKLTCDELKQSKTYLRTNDDFRYIYIDDGAFFQRKEEVMGNTNSFTFELYTDLLYIKYNEEQKQDEDLNLCKWSKNIKFEWL